MPAWCFPDSQKSDDVSYLQVGSSILPPPMLHQDEWCFYPPGFSISGESSPVCSSADSMPCLIPSTFLPPSPELASDGSPLQHRRNVSQFWPEPFVRSPVFNADMSPITMCPPDCRYHPMNQPFFPAYPCGPHCMPQKPTHSTVSIADIGARLDSHFFSKDSWVQRKHRVFLNQISEGECPPQQPPTDVPWFSGQWRFCQSWHRGRKYR